MKYLDDILVQLAPLSAKIAALSVRERVLVMTTGLAAMVMLWHTMFMAPLALRADQSRTELTALNERISVANLSLQDQVLQIAGNSSQDRHASQCCASASTKSTRRWAITLSN